jgi:hypothetical protein
VHQLVAAAGLDAVIAALGEQGSSDHRQSPRQPTAGDGGTRRGPRRASASRVPCDHFPCPAARRLASTAGNVSVLAGSGCARRCDGDPAMARARQAASTSSGIRACTPGEAPERDGGDEDDRYENPLIRAQPGQATSRRLDAHLAGITLTDHGEASSRSGSTGTGHGSSARDGRHPGTGDRTSDSDRPFTCPEFPHRGEDLTQPDPEGFAEPFSG